MKSPWQYAELETVATIKSGGTPRKSNSAFWGGDIPWLSAKDLKTFRLNTSIDRITDKAVQDGAKMTPEGSILVLVRGMTLMKSFPVGVTQVPVSFNQDLKAIQPNKEKIDSYFLGNYLSINGEKMKSFVTQAGHGTGRLPLEALQTFPIPLPSLLEQRKIAEILGTWDLAIETQQQLINSLVRRKKALMQQLLTGKTRLPGFEDAWEEVKLGDYFYERRERNHNDLKLLAITAKGGIVDRDSLTKTDTSNSDKSKYLRITPGDIGYNTMRMWQGVSGLSTMEGIVSPAYTILTPTEDIHPEFAAYLFKLPELVFKFKRFSQGLVDDTLSLKYQAFKIIKTSIPKVLEEQKAIAQVLTTADSEITLHTNHLATLRTQKRGLMQQLLTGKTRVAL